MIHNPRVWYNVRYIGLKTSFRYDLGFVKQLNMKMFKLILIDFGNHCPFLSYDKNNSYETILDSIITITGTFDNIKSINQWLTFALPNLRNLIRCDGDYLTKHNQLTPILNYRTEQLDVSVYIDLKSFFEGR